AELVSSSNQCAKYKHFLSIKKAPFFTTLPKKIIFKDEKYRLSDFLWTAFFYRQCGKNGA
ncbi:hypothetical protein, partial [Capnocytophaga canis]|uniref:hypothetical protein n=1 Tax=Capnocytophaga canis TaxID=1848903 RepID=UPI0005A75F21